MSRQQQIAQGDREALAAEFNHYRPKLKRMIQFRLDHRLRGRIDPSDVLQEASIDVARRASEYAAREDMPFFLWLRLITGQKLLEIHRRHLATQQRDVTREVTIGDIGPEVNSHFLASQLLGKLTSASKKLEKAERQAILESILNRLSCMDREILTLRHFEELSNGEIAEVLGISKTTASNRYVRALARLRRELSEIPGFLPDD
ncbi:MAG: sigma-70 family RNA polymerase sigma factor [bacterium]|nr:sigma-70 family RNA polymerase sigma factor [bacterium]